MQAVVRSVRGNRFRRLFTLAAIGLLLLSTNLFVVPLISEDPSKQTNIQYPGGSFRPSLASNVQSPKTKPFGAKTPRILYYNTHAGTKANMEYITGRLGLNLSHFNPDTVQGAWEMTQQRAEELVAEKFAASTCRHYDIVIIADTFPHGRALVQSLLSDNPELKCGAQIVAELTNRFDWGLEHNRGLWDTTQLHKALWRIESKAKGPKILWTENNPLESRHLADFTWTTPEFRLLRPVGFSPVPALEISEEESKLVAVYPADGMTPSPLTYILEKLEIPHKVLPKHYGGPKTLAKYRAYMELPYQVSTMKLYENLAAGVVMLFPSKAFMTELVLKDIMFFYPALTMFRTGKDEPDWERFMDYYHPDLAPYFYYFDSFEHLREIILSPNPIDKNNVRTEGPKYYEGIRNKTVRGWAHLINELGFQVIADGEIDSVNAGTVDAPYRPHLPNATIQVTSKLDESFNRLHDWKMAEEQRFSEIRQNMYKSMTFLELSALQYRLWMEEAPSKRTMTGFLPKFDAVDAQLVDMINRIEAIPSKNASQVDLGLILTPDSIDLINDMTRSVGPFGRLYRKQYRSFAHLARILRITHSALKLVKKLDRESGMTSVEEKLNVSFEGSKQLAYPWLLSKMFKSFSSLTESYSIDRGIVFVIEDSGYDKVLRTIHHLRKNLGCTLPVEVFYNGDYHLDDVHGKFRKGDIRLKEERRQTLDSMPGVITRDIHHAFDMFWEQADTTEHSKSYALVASKFKQVIYIQEDQILLANPDKIITDSTAFQNHGVFLQKAHAKEGGNGLWVKWFLGGEKFASSETQQSRYFRNKSRNEVDGGFMAFDKARDGVLHGLLVACQLNRNNVRDGSIDWFLDVNSGKGESDAYWIGLELVRAPFQILATPPGIAHSKSTICGPTVFFDESGAPIRLNSKLWDWPKLLGLSILEKMKDDSGHGFLEDDSHFCVQKGKSSGSGVLDEIESVSFQGKMKDVLVQMSKVGTK
ncbi:mannosyltransferase putative-domain-containing protein [Chytriomyces cf. hyalinus JEL632]|nr:mannosyltransferase putative-domain-containing protein [Chytriomyces cf. hyalinus JEL632]